MLLEELRRFCLPECMVVHLNEQKVVMQVISLKVPALHKEVRKCFYCHKTYVVANCFHLKRKEQQQPSSSSSVSQPKGIVGLIQSGSSFYSFILHLF